MDVWIIIEYSFKVQFDMFNVHTAYINCIHVVYSIVQLYVKNYSMLRYTVIYGKIFTNKYTKHCDIKKWCI